MKKDFFFEMISKNALIFSFQFFLISHEIFMPPHKYELKLTLSFNQKKSKNFRQKSATVQKLWQKIDFLSGTLRSLWDRKG